MCVPLEIGVVDYIVFDVLLEQGLFADDVVETRTVRNQVRLLLTAETADSQLLDILVVLYVVLQRLILVLSFNLLYVVFVVRLVFEKLQEILLAQLQH